MVLNTMFLPVFILKILANFHKIIYYINIFGNERRNRTVEFSVRRFKYEILSSSSQSKTATIFKNWITIPFFKRILQESIS